MHKSIPFSLGLIAISLMAIAGTLSFQLIFSNTRSSAEKLSATPEHESTNEVFLKEMIQSSQVRLAANQADFENYLRSTPQASSPVTLEMCDTINQRQEARTQVAAARVMTYIDPTIELEPVAVVPGANPLAHAFGPATTSPTDPRSELQKLLELSLREEANYLKYASRGYAKHASNI